MYKRFLLILINFISLYPIVAMERAGEDIMQVVAMEGDRGDSVHAYFSQAPDTKILAGDEDEETVLIKKTGDTVALHFFKNSETLSTMVNLNIAQKRPYELDLQEWGQQEVNCLLHLLVACEELKQDRKKYEVIQVDFSSMNDEELDMAAGQVDQWQIKPLFPIALNVIPRILLNKGNDDKLCHFTQVAEDFKLDSALLPRVMNDSLCYLRHVEVPAFKGDVCPVFTTHPTCGAIAVYEHANNVVMIRDADMFVSLANLLLPELYEDWTYKNFVFSPDGAHGISVIQQEKGLSARVRFIAWALKNQKMLFTHEIRDSHGGASYFPDGKKIACFSGARIDILDACTGAELKSIRFTEEMAHLESTDISTCGRYLICVKRDYLGNNWNKIIDLCADSLSISQALYISTLKHCKLDKINGFTPSKYLTELHKKLPKEIKEKVVELHNPVLQRLLILPKFK